MTKPKPPVAVQAAEAPPRRRPSNYPEPFASRMAGREKRPLGDLFGLTNFGVNLTRLSPGAVSALRHAHSRQDEFVYMYFQAAPRSSPMREKPSSRPACAPDSRPGPAMAITS